MRVIAVIPARYAATRLPGKPLADILGKPMVQWVYERTRRARGVDQVIVATDDQRIVDAVEAFGGQAMMTRLDHTSGTDRLAEVASKVTETGSDAIFINVQGDEPMMDPRAIEAALSLVKSGKFKMSTAMTPLKTQEDLDNPAVVKVLVDKKDRAIYFSRFAIPYSRAPHVAPHPFVCKRHVGLYVYTREILMRITQLPVSEIERGESLEQLRALEDGVEIGIQEVDFVSIGVDTPQELEKARLWLSKENSSS